MRLLNSNILLPFILLIELGHYFNLKNKSPFGQIMDIITQKLVKYIYSILLLLNLSCHSLAKISSLFSLFIHFIFFYLSSLSSVLPNSYFLDHLVLWIISLLQVWYYCTVCLPRSLIFTNRIYIRLASFPTNTTPI